MLGGWTGMVAESTGKEYISTPVLSEAASRSVVVPTHHCGRILQTGAPVSGIDFLLSHFLHSNLAAAAATDAYFIFRRGRTNSATTGELKPRISFDFQRA